MQLGVKPVRREAEGRQGSRGIGCNNGGLSAKSEDLDPLKNREIKGRFTEFNCAKIRTLLSVQIDCDDVILVCQLKIKLYLAPANIKRQICLHMLAC